MAVTDEDFRTLATLIKHRRTGLRLNESNRLTDGLYFENRSTAKWVLSIYRNVKRKENELELAIDPRGISWDPAEVAAARACLVHIGREMGAKESGIHAAQPADAIRLGFSFEQTRRFAERFVERLTEHSPQRWHVPPDIARAMLETVKQTVAQSGLPAVTVAKTKEFRFLSEQAFLVHVRLLLAASKGRCALTCVELKEGDPELAHSLDRIDSDGHYESGNLQIVARFANRWKSDKPDAAFRALLAQVRLAGAQ
jgi:hypothetical protein